MIKVGDRLPAGSFRQKQMDDSVKQLSTDELFKGQKVVFVGVPGAFTSTCHNAHIPTFVKNEAAIKAKGIDRILVMAVNDQSVMKMWGESLGAAGKVEFVADGNGDYARALGLEVDMTASGMGKRVRRFSMVVDDGTVKAINFEPEGGKGIQTTGAATILGQL